MKGFLLTIGVGLMIIGIGLMLLASLWAMRELRQDVECLSDTDLQTTPRGQNLAKTGVVGVASWYDYDLNGIEWSKQHNTCATRDFKRYSTVRTTNLDNGKSIECFVNDYGPELGQTPERIMDLSSHAFSQIADLKIGLINIKIEEL
jgi:rare lipoprotein A (peptidoglycan hydrolase)